MRWSADIGKVIDLSVCTVAGIVYCILTFHDLRLPGPHYDEVFPAAPAVNFYENRYDTEPMQIDPSRISIFSRPIPLMLMTYVGSVQTLMYVPAFLLFGDDLAVVRGLPIIVGLIALWLFYFFARDLFDRNVGIIAVMLLLADAGFVFYVGRDFGPPAISLLCKIGGLYALLVWWRKKQLRALVAGMFLFGIGVYHKADFLWVLTAASLTAVLVLWNDLKPRLTGRVLIAGAAFFALGAAPFFLLNIMAGGVSFAPLIKASAAGNALNAAITSLLYRGEQLVHLMSGRAPLDLFLQDRYFFSGVATWVVPSIILAAFVRSIAASLLGISGFSRRAVLGVVLFPFLLFAQTAVSPSLGAHHLLAAYPYLHLGAALGLATMFRVSAHRIGGLLRYVIHVIPVITLSVGITTVFTTYRQLEQTGGNGHWSDAIYELNSYLLEQQRQVAAMDWGFTNNLIVLSRGALTIDRVYAETWKEVNVEKYLEMSLNDTTLYLFHAPEYTAIHSLQGAFFSIATARGYRPRVEKEFFQRDGRKVYVLFKLERV